MSHNRLVDTSWNIQKIVLTKKAHQKSGKTSLDEVAKIPNKWWWYAGGPLPRHSVHSKMTIKGSRSAK